MPANRVHQIPAGARSPVLEIASTFPFQSWFDSTLLQQAIAIQPAGTKIVAGIEEAQNGGYSLILHRSSQTPISVTAKGEGSAPTIYTLAPGQAIAPLGDKPFRSFTWGLPYGWLGGGMAKLLVTQQQGEPTFGDARPEIPFHRARFAIRQPAALATGGAGGTFNNSPLNWPIRFPWVQSSNQSGVAQPGAPVLAPEPTRIVMVLRPPLASQVAGASPLIAPASMLAIIEGADDFCLDAGGIGGQLDQSGSIQGSFPIQDSFIWPAWTNVGTSGNLAVQNPELTIAEGTGGQALLRLGCSGIPFTTTAVGVTFVDTSGGALAGFFVDVVRYGRL